MFDVEATVTAILARTPEWIRSDLASKDVGFRRRAEESLAAMIANALAPADASSDDPA